MDIGLYLRVIVWPLLNFLCKIHILFCLARNIDRSSYELLILSSGQFWGSPFMDASCWFSHNMPGSRPGLKQRGAVDI